MREVLKVREKITSFVLSTSLLIIFETSLNLFAHYICNLLDQLLLKAREENTRLLALLAEREQRIEVLEGRIATLYLANTPCRGETG